MLFHDTSVNSSRARGGGYRPPIGLLTKMQNKENTTFLALLRLSFALELTKTDLRYLFIYLFICVKRKSAHRERKKKKKNKRSHTHTHKKKKKKVYSHALIILKRQRRTVSFSQTIYTKQIYEASNIFRRTKSARVK